jgi:hypothetical protein
VTSEEEKTTERESRDVAKKQIRKKKISNHQTPTMYEILKRCEKEYGLTTKQKMEDQADVIKPERIRVVLV